LRVVLACAGVVLFGGCAASPPGSGDGYFAVNSRMAQVYRFGPSQPTGADAVLKQGQRVIMLRQEFGYSRVMTEEGLTGYIANDLISPAPPPPKPTIPPRGIDWAKLSPLPSRGTSVPGVSSANRAILQKDPLFGGDELPPLPSGDAKPGFRFRVPAPAPPPP
jgi:hypothetical protein